MHTMFDGWVYARSKTIWYCTMRTWYHDSHQREKKARKSSSKVTSVAFFFCYFSLWNHRFTVSTGKLNTVIKCHIEKAHIIHSRGEPLLKGFFFCGTTSMWMQLILLWNSFFLCSPPSKNEADCCRSTTVNQSRRLLAGNTGGATYTHITKLMRTLMERPIVFNSSSWQSLLFKN